MDKLINVFDKLIQNIDSIEARFALPFWFIYFACNPRMLKFDVYGGTNVIIISHGIWKLCEVILCDQVLALIQYGFSSSFKTKTL